MCSTRITRTFARADEGDADKQGYLGQVGFRRHDSVRDDARVGSLEPSLRCRFLEARENGFEQGAVCTGLTLEAAQANALLVELRSLALEFSEALGKRGFTRQGHVGFVADLLDDLPDLETDLAPQIGHLGAHRQDLGVLAPEDGGELGHLADDRGLPLAQALDKPRGENLRRRLDATPGFEQLVDLGEPGRDLGPLCPRQDELGADLGDLRGRDRRVVLALHQPVFAAVEFDHALGTFDGGAQGGDAPAQPFRGALRSLELGFQLIDKVVVGHGIGDEGGFLRVRR